MPRQMDWIDTRVGLTIANLAQDRTAIDGASTQVVQRGTTIIRTIVSIDINSASVAGAWGIQLADLAIGIGDREAFSVGTLPDPSSAIDKPARGWMWRTSITVSQNGVGGEVIHRIRADVRGARKIDLGRAYLIVDNTAIGGTTFSIEVRGLIRTLVKLA